MDRLEGIRGVFWPNSFNFHSIRVLDDYDLANGNCGDRPRNFRHQGFADR